MVGVDAFVEGRTGWYSIQFPLDTTADTFLFLDRVQRDFLDNVLVCAKGFGFMADGKKTQISVAYYPDSNLQDFFKWSEEGGIKMHCGFSNYIGEPEKCSDAAKQKKRQRRRKKI